MNDLMKFKTDFYLLGMSEQTPILGKAVENFLFVCVEWAVTHIKFNERSMQIQNRQYCACPSLTHPRNVI